MKIEYVSKNENEKWMCSVEIKKIYNEYTVVEFIGGDCFISAYIGVDTNGGYINRWIVLPQHKRYSELAELGDVYWNENALYNAITNLEERNTIIYGLKALEGIIH